MNRHGTANWGTSMSDLRASLLTSCAFGAEQSDTGTDEVATGSPGVVATVEPDAGASPLPSAPNRAPNSPRAPPLGVKQPAVQQLQPIGLSPDQAAQFLGTSRSRIYRLLREGRLAALKQGVATVVTMDSLMAYVDSLPAATFRSLEEPAAA
jgi:excisionase family DNA binding protein